MPRTRRRAAKAADEKIKCLTAPDGANVESREPRYPVAAYTATQKKGGHLVLTLSLDDSRRSAASRSTSSSPAPQRQLPELTDDDCFELPESTGDLLIADELVLELLGVYETLRTFERPLRLSPFRFEDFSAALVADERSTLMSEVHMCLLKALLVEDELCGVVYGPHEERESINMQWALLDPMTLPACLLSYLNADPDFAAVRSMCETWDDYPIVPVAVRVRVLSFLCERVAETSLIRNHVNVDGAFESEDNCRTCGRLGDMLCCDRCPAVYHLYCLRPPLITVPEGDWTCPTCVQMQQVGVDNYSGETCLRRTPLGTDSYGRRYWFLCRRIFV